MCNSTSVIAGYEALVGRCVVGEGPAHELVVEGALDLAGDLILDVVHDRVKVPRVAVVRPLVGAVQVT